MANSHSLSLSHLRASTEYPLLAGTAEGKCLIHVKLTEACARAVDGLLTSEKGAVFSLWFNENGGHLSVPGGSSGGSPRRFQFSTAVVHKADRQMGSLECLQQSSDPGHGQQQLTCLGTMRHKLTVKATDDVYEKTKIRVTQVEEERKGHVTKVINITRDYSKNKLSSSPGHQLYHRSPMAKMGKSPGSKPIPPPPSSTTVGSGGMARPRDAPVGGAGSTFKSIAAAASSRTPRSLRDRVIHLLALKPLNRLSIVTKLKKATKRGENSMGNLDTILTEVSDSQNSTYHLKTHLLFELDVDSWPFYSEAERSLVKRRINNCRQSSSTNEHVPQTAQKRPPTSDFASGKLSEAPSTKKPKLSSTTTTSTDHSSSYLHVPSFSKKPSPPTSQENRSPPVISHMPTLLTATAGTTTPSQSTAMSRTSSAATTAQPKPPLLPASNNLHDSLTSAPETLSSADKKSEIVGGREGLVPMDAGANSQPKDTVKSEPPDSVSREKKKKKKHKQHRGTSPSPVTNVCPPASASEPSHPQERSKMATAAAASTAPEVPDFSRKFPSIVSDQQRAHYKKEFNHVYGEYLGLKQATDEVQSEVKTLTEQLDSLSRDSNNFKEVEKKIKRKYLEMQSDKAYQKNRKRFLELHYKLEHIKKMVVRYDNSCTSHLATS